MSADGQGTNIAENFNQLSRAHERYRQTDDRQTDLRRHIANVNVSSLKVLDPPCTKLRGLRVLWCFE